MSNWTPLGGRAAHVHSPAAGPHADVGHVRSCRPASRSRYPSLPGVAAGPSGLELGAVQRSVRIRVAGFGAAASVALRRGSCMRHRGAGPLDPQGPPSLRPRPSPSRAAGRRAPDLSPDGLGRFGGDPSRPSLGPHSTHGGLHGGMHGGTHACTVSRHRLYTVTLCTTPEFSRLQTGILCLLRCTTFIATSVVPQKPPAPVPAAPTANHTWQHSGGLSLQAD